MIRVEPMPHELAVAHAGRMALFNCCVTPTERDRLIRDMLNADGHAQGPVPRLNQLALVSGMSLAGYARQHSMLAALRVAARPDQQHVHGSPESAAFTKRMGMVAQRSGAYLCPQCVKEDLDHWQFSWFRRTHQLEGVDWCPTHRSPLVRVAAKTPWERLPHQWVEIGDIAPVEQGVASLVTDEFEVRLMEIATSLLEAERPADVRALVQGLAARARAC